LFEKKVEGFVTFSVFEEQFGYLRQVPGRGRRRRQREAPSE
jgi:hypothetical protein